jgi:hypothetical protein
VGLADCFTIVPVRLCKGSHLVVRRDKLEEIKLLQKLRKKSGGTTADALAAGAKDEILTAPRADSEERQLPTELMDTFSKAKVVVADTDEDPHM